MRVRLVTFAILGCTLAVAPHMLAQSKKKKTTPDAQSANPFPEAQSEAAAKSARHGDAKTQAPPAAPSNASAPAKGKQSSPAADNPFPETQSQAAASQDARQGAQQPAQAPSTSAGGYSSSSQALPPSDVGQGPSPQANGKVPEDSYTMDKHPDTRIKNDLNVADFYFKNGNYRGAYLRYQDTLKYDPVNETALFGAAMTMCKQNLTQDALHNFRDYLQIYPKGKYTRQAAAIVDHPARCTHNP